MAFSREDLAAYEKQPQKMIDDKVSPFRGATPAKAADPAAVAAVAAGQLIDATPGGTPAAAAAPAPTSDDAPVVDEEGTLGDPTGSGEGTSDETTADPSTATVEHGDEVDPNADLTGDGDPAPKKGSARERIVELLDLSEGYKEYGKLKDAQVKELQAQLARLSSPAGTAAAPAAVTPPAATEDDEPMPDMTDEDVQFDSDKYRAKMMKWVKSQTTRAAKEALREVSGADTARQALKKVGDKCEAYAKDHPDFEEVVSKNPVLAANQLSPDAAALVGDSEHTAELLYRFGKDNGLAIRTARMSPTQQIVQVTNMIRDIEDERKASKSAPQGGAKPPAKKSTQAPPPPRPIPAAGRASTREETDPNMSMEEFARQHRSRKQSSREAARKLRGLN